MNLTIYTDGGSLNNPGQAAYGFLVYSGKKLLHKQNERIGIASNNVAEYMALIRALEFVCALINPKLQNPKLIECHPELDLGSSINMDPRLRGDDNVESIQVISDSLLLVNQVNGFYKVKNVDIKPLHSKIKMLEMELGLPISYKHVLRDKNTEADALVKEALGV